MAGKILASIAVAMRKTMLGKIGAAPMDVATILAHLFTALGMVLSPTLIQKDGIVTKGLSSFDIGFPMAAAFSHSMVTSTCLASP